MSNPTILSKHSQWPNELHPWCVHRDEDHTVLAVSKKQEQRIEAKTSFSGGSKQGWVCASLHCRGNK